MAAGPPPAAYGQVPAGPLGGFMAGTAAGGADGPLAPALQALLATLANGSRQAADAHAEAAWKLEGRDLKVGRRRASPSHLALVGLSSWFIRLRACLLQPAPGMVCVGCGLRSCKQACSKVKKSRRQSSRVGRRSDCKAEGWRRDYAFVSLGSSRCQRRRNVTEIRQIRPQNIGSRAVSRRTSLQTMAAPFVQNQALSGSGQVSTSGLSFGPVMAAELAWLHVMSGRTCAVTAWDLVWSSMHCKLPTAGSPAHLRTGLSRRHFVLTVRRNEFDKLSVVDVIFQSGIVQCTQVCVLFSEHTLQACRPWPMPNTGSVDVQLRYLGNKLQIQRRSVQNPLMPARQMNQAINCQVAVGGAKGLHFPFLSPYTPDCCVYFLNTGKQRCHALPAGSRRGSCPAIDGGHS